jgi:tRNA pseudouridine55 synthase
MAKRRPPTSNGFVVIDKPAKMTSHDVVAKLRKQFNEKRVGHAGTLDPDATGVLLVGVGYVTRLMTYLSGMPKSYLGEVVLGSTTTTLDDSGEVTGTYDMSAITPDDVASAAKRFVGEIEQVPPMVSALKVDGRRLHELAREGIEVERKARTITIHSLTVAPTKESNVFAIDVTCSSGTYIRTLAADLGTALGGGAHLRNLRRTSVGPFGLADAQPLESATLRSSREALRSMESVVVDDEIVASIRNGRSLPLFDGNGPWALVDSSDRLVAVYEHGGDVAKPGVVFAEPIA